MDGSNAVDERDRSLGAALERDRFVLAEGKEPHTPSRRECCPNELEVVDVLVSHGLDLSLPPLLGAGG
jgi:hypothetical protein